jgi:oxygen-independent coproporphyrinogen-3 oxidase
MGFHVTDQSRVPVPQVVELAYGLYPGVQFFCAEYAADDYREWVEQSNGDPVPAPLAVYIHDSGGEQSPPVRGKHISSSRKPAALEQELRLQGTLFDSDRRVQQLICSGGIATEWTDDQLYQLVSVLQDVFTTSQDGLVNWCACVGNVLPTEARLRLLRVLGFTNIRLRIPNPALPGSSGAGPGALRDSESLAASARQLGMRQLAVELHTGGPETALPLEWLKRFILGVQPDRVRLVDSLQATGREALASLRDSYLPTLAESGYQHIGLGWFVRANDPWWEARLARRLNWSLLGFTDMPGPDVVGIGPGAVSSIGDFYAHNACAWDQYQRLLDRNVVPVVRGLELEHDDVLRREIMAAMLTRSQIDITQIEDKWGIQFNQFFAEELNSLKAFQQAGWVSTTAQSIVVHARGRRELTELCRAFDRRRRVTRDQYTPSCA